MAKISQTKVRSPKLIFWACVFKFPLEFLCLETQLSQPHRIPTQTETLPMPRRLSQPLRAQKRSQKRPQKRAARKCAENFFWWFFGRARKPARKCAENFFWWFFGRARKLLKRAVNQFCDLKFSGRFGADFRAHFRAQFRAQFRTPPFWVNFQVFGRTVFGSTWGQLLAKLSGAEHCMRISSNFNIALEINCCAKFVQIKNNKNREKHAGKTA